MKWALTYLLLISCCILQQHDPIISITKDTAPVHATKQIPNNRLTGIDDLQLPDLLLPGTCEEDDESTSVRKRSSFPVPYSMLNKVLALTIAGPLERVRQCTMHHSYYPPEKYIFEKSLLV